MNSIKAIQDLWVDHSQRHSFINDSMTYMVNADPELKAYRDWIEQKIFGFGERSFIWLWKLLVDEMPPAFQFLEVGVFRGQSIGAVRLVSNKAKKFPIIYGITPLDSTGGHWESDYAGDIKLLHETFGLQQPEIIKGLSTDPFVREEALSLAPFDIVYIDGGHEYEVAKHDIETYSPMVIPGGYLVIDDCANKYNLPDGYFRGIETVSRAVDELLPNKDFTELFNVVHIRVFKRNG